MEQRKITLKNKLMYGCGDIFGGGAFLLLSLLFLNYLTDVELMSPALAGAIIMIGKIVDAIWDPFIGGLSDRTKSKVGRRRIYFLYSIVPIFITFTLLWYSFSIKSNVWLFTYYLFVYVLFNIVFSMAMVPYNSILPDITKDYQERTSFTGIRMIFSVTSAILAGILPKIIVNASGADIKNGYLIMGMVFAILYSIPWIFVFLGTWENRDKNEKIENTNMLKQMKNVFRNKSFRIHASMFLSGQTAVDVMTTLFIYYLTVCLNIQNKFSLVLGTLLIVQLISVPIHTKLSKKYSKTTPLRVGFTVWLCTLAFAIFLSPSSPSFAIYLIAGFSGFGTAASVLVPWSILPEIADVDEMITSKRREGIYSGMTTFLRKFANGIAIGVIGFLLQAVGYVKPETAGQVSVQSAGTTLGIKLMFCLIPIIFISLSMFFSKKYSMTEEKYNILMSEIKRRKNGGKAKDVSEPVKKVCEELTGLKYESLYKPI